MEGGLFGWKGGFPDETGAKTDEIGGFLDEIGAKADEIGAFRFHPESPPPIRKAPFHPESPPSSGKPPF